MFGNSSKNQILTNQKKLSFPSSKLNPIDAGIVLAGFLFSFIFTFLIIIIKSILGVKSISQIFNIPGDILQISIEYIIALGIIGVIYYFILKKYQLTWFTFGFKKIPITKTIAYIALAFLFTFVGWLIVAPLVMIFLPFINLEEPQQIFSPDMSLVGQILMIIYAVILGPFLEEVVFRGVILTAVSNRWNFVVGIIISTLIWSLLHFQLNVIIFTSIFGIILSYIYLKSQSLWPSYITHVLKNLIAVIAIYFFGLV